MSYITNIHKDVFHLHQHCFSEANCFSQVIIHQSQETMDQNMTIINETQELKLNKLKT
jgi:hypothetical protein